MRDLASPSGFFLLGDCLERMKEIPSGSVDMILCDLPYGTTQNKWDAVIPFEPLWAEYWRVAKSNAAVVLTAAQPFTSALVMSQARAFKHDWTWRKTAITGVLNAKRMPVRNHEDILVFAQGPTTYNPQGLVRKGTVTKQGGNSDNYGSRSSEDYVQEWTNYPRSVLEIASERGFHPTQKPVALFEYLIRTYTDEGMTVLDNCAGSGTTAIAAMRSNRRFICIERDEVYFEKACQRVQSEMENQDGQRPSAETSPSVGRNEQGPVPRAEDDAIPVGQDEEGRPLADNGGSAGGGEPNHTEPGDAGPSDRSSTLHGADDMKPETGTVVHCVKTQDGRYMIVVSTGKNKLSAYAESAYAVGASVTVRDGVVL